MRRNQGDSQDQPGGQRRGQPQGQPQQSRQPTGPQPGQQGGQPRQFGQGGPQQGGPQQPGGQSQTGGRQQHQAGPPAGGAPRQQPQQGMQGGGVQGQPTQHTPGQPQGRGQPAGMGAGGPTPGQPGAGGQPAPQPGPGPQAMGGPGMARGMGQPGLGPRLEPVTIDDIVQTNVVTAEQDTPVATVVAEMAEQDVGSVIVVEDDRPTGVLTDRKICLALEDDPQVTERTAGDLVSGDLHTGTTDDSVFDAIQQMSDESIRRLPVVDDDGTLEGIVTLDDILVLLGSELHNAVDVIREQSPRI